MLSRMVLNVNLQKSVSFLGISQVRSVTYIDPKFLPQPLPWNEKGPERDLVNFPTLKQPDFAPPQRFMCIPDNWFQFFYKKTGVTGPYLFGLNIFLALSSKEYFLMDHHSNKPLVAYMMWIYVFYITKGDSYIFHQLWKYFVEGNEKRMYEQWGNIKTTLEQFIALEEKEKWRLESQKMVYDVKRENVTMQVEATYRQNNMAVYEKVKRYLDYHADIEKVVERVKQRYMVEWVIEKVRASITPDQEKQSLQKCIADLNMLAARA